MTKKDYRSKKGKRNASYLMIHRYMTKCSAWSELKPADKAVYLILLDRYKGNNNGRISLSIREAAEIANIAKGTACKSFKNLESKGFVKSRFVGSFSQKKRLASEWELTHVSYNGYPATKDFMRYSSASRKPSKRAKPVTEVLMENKDVV